MLNTEYEYEAPVNADWCVKEPSPVTQSFQEVNL